MRSEIAVFYSSTGREKVVIQDGRWPNKYPFKQMAVGDWFELYADEVTGGNFTNLASYWGGQLKRKFQTRTIGTGSSAKIRVTRLK